MSDKVTETLKRLQNPAVASYLDLMSDTETPAIFHVWTLISAAAASLTRRCWFQMGAIRVMPNMYIALVGPPGVRKSQSINYAKILLEQSEGIRFAPDSTGGYLQGLISAMQGKVPSSREDDNIDAVLNDIGGLQLGGMDLGSVADTHVANRHSLYVTSGEWASFIGMKSDAFITFLGDMWDASGRDFFEYTLKRETTRIDLPCLNMIGGITPMHFTTYLPPQAVGQGFTSRMLLVYADRPTKRIAWPEPFNEKLLADFKQLFNWIFTVPEGEIRHSIAARQAIIAHYDYNIGIEDARFISYGQRRQSHLVKTAMALAVLRASTIVDVEDVEDAHILLALTEKTMPDCLGEYGLSPIAIAKSRVTEVLRNATEPMSINRLIMASGGDVNRNDVNKALYELTSSSQVIEVQLRDPAGTIRIGYVWPRETNAFRTNQQVVVPYLLSDTGHDRPRATTPQVDMSAPATAGNLTVPEMQAPAARITESGGVLALLTKFRQSKGADT
jgi:hypothetical protein